MRSHIRSPHRLPCTPKSTDAVWMALGSEALSHSCGGCCVVFVCDLRTQPCSGWGSSHSPEHDCTCAQQVGGLDGVLESDHWAKPATVWRSESKQHQGKCFLRVRPPLSGTMSLSPTLLVPCLLLSHTPSHGEVGNAHVVVGTG